jgi:solute carrier family 25 S-adenosylmethionine transporter 26
MLASALGECAACLVRVPTENVKQKMQAGLTKSVTGTIQYIMASGGFSKFYRGYFTTLGREIPFSTIQFPLYEQFKKKWATLQAHELSLLQAAACGALAGSIAAAATTPIDVVKTRIMLVTDAEGVPYHGFRDVFRRVTREEGFMKLFSGVGPRVTWITIGGFVFFGTYETGRKYLASFNKE